jgi:hypothetical protein
MRGQNLSRDLPAPVIGRWGRSPHSVTAAKGRQEVTVTDTGSEMIPRREFLKKLMISDSTERRGRTGSGDWPPHIRILSKVYYRRAAVDDWIRRREAISQSQIGPQPEGPADD